MKTRVFAVCAVIFLFCGFTHAGLNDGLVAYYPFNGNANDESGNGHNGTVNGATLTQDRFGNKNSAYSFALGNYIVVQPSHSLLFSSSFTVLSWIKTTYNRGAIATENWADRGGNFGFGINNSKFGFMTNSQDNVYSIVVNDGIWHQIVGVYDALNSTLYHYVDGSLVLSKQSGPSNTDPSMSLVMGDENAHNWQYEGLIDDVRLYNRALSVSEIKQLYQGQGTCSSDIVTFTAGTPAKASDVNSNFGAHNCQIQALQTQVQALKSIVCTDHPTASVCQ